MRYRNNRAQTWLHMAMVVVTGTLFIVVLLAALFGWSEESNSCEDKGGEYIMARDGRSYCVEVIE